MTDTVPPLIFKSVDVPGLLSPAEHAARYRATEHGKTMMRRHSAAWQRRKDQPRYLSRPFVGWDGEGVTRDDGSHDYVMFASSHGDRIQTVDGSLHHSEIFETLLDAKERDPNGIHVIYGGSYDFNMWLKGLDVSLVERLYRSPYPVPVGPYQVRWRPGKNMFIRHGKRTVTIYDVVSFFQCSFVQACDEYLYPLLNWHEREMIIANKRLRGSFTVEQMDEIARYNDAELVNLVGIMTELRERLCRANLRLSRWDGPGAIASVVLQNNRIKDHMSVTPEPIAEHVRRAYFGGRFEVLLHGRSPDGETVYQYDINSAYPSAMRELPSLARGRWVHHRKGGGLRKRYRFALYRVKWQQTHPMQLGPLPYRTGDGHIYYPRDGHGWYWSPEVTEALKHPSAQVTVLECWEWQPDQPELRPFAFVEPMYNKRRALKRAGDGAQAGLKLALNSLYGKTAQQVGWHYKDGTLVLPPFHQLEFSGFITSHCRAQIMAAARQAPESVIAVETDAIFTNAPLDLRIGTGLGEWSETVYSSLTYCQSGVYFATTLDGDELKNKTRGIDLGSVSRADIEAVMDRPTADKRTVTVPLHRFNGAGIALMTDWSAWCTWTEDTKQLTVEPMSGKRIHRMYCHCGLKKGLLQHKGWHTATCPYEPTMWEDGEALSAEHRVMWVNPQATEDQEDIDGMRQARYERDWE